MSQYSTNHQLYIQIKPALLYIIPYRTQQLGHFDICLTACEQSLVQLYYFLITNERTTCNYNTESNANM